MLYTRLKTQLLGILRSSHQIRKMKARIPPGPWNQPLTGGLRERSDRLARNDSVLRVKTTAYAQALPFRHEIPLWRPRRDRREITAGEGCCER